jgi:pterin-4a-carbinolamine dehydratase
MLNKMQCVGIRGAYWDHDVKLLLRRLDWAEGEQGTEESAFDPYPCPPPETIGEIGWEQLDVALRTALKGWKKVISELPEDRSKSREELFREYKFATFQQAIEFMSLVAKGCDVANHHPRWENIWKTLRVYLTTWNIGHRISDRDIQLAKYFDSAYADFVKRDRSRDP